LPTCRKTGISKGYFVIISENQEVLLNGVLLQILLNGWYEIFMDFCQKNHKTRFYRQIEQYKTSKNNFSIKSGTKIQPFHANLIENQRVESGQGVRRVYVGNNEKSR
jgi:hypothetical protein